MPSTNHKNLNFGTILYKTHSLLFNIFLLKTMLLLTNDFTLHITTCKQGNTNQKNSCQAL